MGDDWDDAPGPQPLLLNTPSHPALKLKFLFVQYGTIHYKLGEWNPSWYNPAGLTNDPSITPQKQQEKVPKAC
jgi:hypothetical protein